MLHFNKIVIQANVMSKYSMEIQVEEVTGWIEKENCITMAHCYISNINFIEQ